MSWLTRRDPEINALAEAVRDALGSKLAELQEQSPAIIIIGKIDVTINSVSAHGGGATANLGVKK